jgi:superfamily I DNA/RNA helicase/mRNA-degrading endonuclease RelE of RelBE toxin-antitoxin system
MTWEIIHKPTFMNQLLDLPSRELGHVMQKVQMLQESPAPDAKNKKRLVGYKGNVYRIRSGDYRILYTFGDGWVTLLGVDKRADVYRGDQLVAEGPGFDVGGMPEIEDILSPKEPAHRPGPETKRTAPVQDDLLPRPITADLLERQRVPEEYRPAFLACKTLDDLLAIAVPEPVRTRVFDVLDEPDYGQVLQQPDLLTGDVDDLLKFTEGELLGFLLRLNPEQEKFVTWAVRAAGPMLVKGGPGTGKSTVALYRVRALIAALRKEGNAQPRILFTTYTNALVAFSRQLLERLLGDDAACVTVSTADSLALRIVTAADGRPHMADTRQTHAALAEARKNAAYDGNALQRRAQAQTIERMSDDYLLEELLSVIEARALATLDDYLATPRNGRRVRLNTMQRTAIWRIYEAFVRIIGRHGLATWQGMRRRAAEIARDDATIERYDGVIVDEAQDLDATVLRLLVTLCRTPDRLFVTADANQSIYGSGFRWTDVHEDLRFQGRTGILRANHRSTREIGEAAHAYLRDGALDEEDDGERTYTQTGPLPAVRAVASAYDETQLLARFLREASRSFRLGVGACAVLAPTEDAGQNIAAWLADAGVPAVFMPGSQLDLGHTAVKVLTLQSAKGLEFPIVAVAGMVDGPVPGTSRGGDADERAESLARARRTMYVAMTRAMRALLVVTPANKQSPLLTGFDPQRWNARVEGTAG